MKTLCVNLPGRAYNIHIGEGILQQAGIYLRKVFDGQKIAVVTDSNVAPLYAEQLENSLTQAGYDIHRITIPAGEESKSHEMLLQLYHEMLNFGLTRTDLIIALGGGVVGDLTGFAASTLLRGIPFVQIPTTLLAQVDSSVGGKVAVNLPEGKNLVGSFYQPKMVLIDPVCLRTLDNRVLADGMAEVIKYGAICDKDLFAMLENIKNVEELFAKITEIIYTCCDIKRRVVEEDEMDTGGRMILNFGHTFGHAIEKYFGYGTYTHGEAVAVGMCMACAYGEKIGLTPSGTEERMKEILKNYQLPVQVDMPKDAFVSAMAVDKKGEGSRINLILLEEIGRVCIRKIDKKDF